MSASHGAGARCSRHPPDSCSRHARWRAGTVRLPSRQAHGRVGGGISDTYLQHASSCAVVRERHLLLRRLCPTTLEAHNGPPARGQRLEAQRPAESLLRDDAALLPLALLGASCRRAGATAFDAGGDAGWVVPPAGKGAMYNQWASKNRFLVGDSVHFKYSKDSVMAVTEEDYNNCRSSHPIFFSNNGDTEVPLDRAGLFYFISGVAGHCERGQRMIVKVIGRDAPPPAPPTPSAATPGTGVLAGAIAATAMALPVIMHGV